MITVLEEFDNVLSHSSSWSRLSFQTKNRLPLIPNILICKIWKEFSLTLQIDLNECLAISIYPIHNTLNITLKTLLNPGSSIKCV